MAALRKIATLSKQRHLSFLKSTALYSTSLTTREKTNISKQEEIIIPYRKERSPTDILEALNSTISRDHTAAHYKYEDDPYFIPVSNITKRSFALSKEAGKKAARFFLEKYPDLFKCNTSVPHIKAFDPPVKYTETDDVTEKILKDCINDLDVENSIEVYTLLKKKEISISQNVKQDLLDLLCFYNNVPPVSDDYYEERFFMKSEASNQKWDAKGMAEKLFDDMEKDGRAYSSMIAGLSKYRESERALLLHDEMKSKNLIGTTHAYNCLISECYLIQEDSAFCWELAVRLLSQMNADGLKPDLYTMNALLRLLSKSPRWRKGNQLSLNIMAEMKRLNIEPSLGSYYYLLMIFGNDPNGPNILYEIMDKVENLEHVIRHPSDVFFFATAMEICWKGLNNKDLAYRLHKLLEFKNNCKLLGNSISESHYFKSFFRLLCETEDIDVFMELYDKYVPSSYTPEPIVTLSIVEAIHFTGAYSHLPRICSDILLFEQSERANIIEALLEAAACTKNEEKIQKPLIEMVWNIFDNLIRRSKTRRVPFEWTGSILTNILRTFMNGKDIEKSWGIIEKLKEDETLILGSPNKSALLEFCQLCLESEDYNKLTSCAKYAANSFYPDFQDDLLNVIEEMSEDNKITEKQKMDVKAALNSASNIEEDSSSSSSGSSSSDSSSDSSSSDEDSESDKTKTES